MICCDLQPQVLMKDDLLPELLDCGVVAVIRLPDGGVLPEVARALQSGGVRCLEITMTMPGAVSLIRTTAADAPADTVVGAGTVMTTADADAVIDAGAQFVVSPMLDIRILELCARRGVVVAPGCFSPTEIAVALNAGAQLIKIFPASVLGRGYLKAIRGPLPHAQLMPTGGVTVDNAGEWIRAGAAVVGIGSDLVDPVAISDSRFDVLTERAQRVVENVRSARTGSRKRS